MGIWMAVGHTCEDYDAWRAAFDEGRVLREEYGAAAEMVFHNGNEVLALVEFPDTNSSARFQGDPRLREGKKRAGVIDAPEISGPWERDA